MNLNFNWMIIFIALQFVYFFSLVIADLILTNSYAMLVFRILAVIIMIPINIKVIRKILY